MFLFEKKIRGKKSQVFNKMKVHITKKKYFAKNFSNFFGVEQFMKHIFKLGALSAVKIIFLISDFTSFRQSFWSFYFFYLLRGFVLQSIINNQIIS